jgi:translation initiation factor RLI1
VDKAILDLYSDYLVSSFGATTATGLNVSLSKSPTQAINSQTNHFFAALWSYIKLEILKLQSKQNHFALKSKLYIQALKQAFTAWLSLKPSQLSV